MRENSLALTVSPFIHCDGVLVVNTNRHQVSPTRTEVHAAHSLLMKTLYDGECLFTRALPHMYAWCGTNLTGRNDILKEGTVRITNQVKF